MSMLVDSGNPEERKTLAVCITSAVPRDEILGEPEEGDMRLFLIEKFTEVVRKTKRLFRIEVDLHESCRWIPLNLFRGGKRLIPPFY